MIFLRNITIKHLTLLTFILSIIVSSVRINNSIYSVIASDTFVEAFNKFGGLDAGSYLNGALQLRGILTNVDGQFDFVWFNWPPGMSIFYYLMSFIPLFFEHALLAGAILQVLSATLIVTIIIFPLSKLGRNFFALVGVMFFFVFSPFRDWILGNGIMYAEGPAIALLVLACFTF